MPAIFHVKIEDDTFDGAVNHIVEASDDDTVWHCEEAGDNFDGAIFHVKWAEDGHEEPVWRVSGISRGTVTTVGPAVSPLSLTDAIANSLQYVKAYGGTEQNGTPTPDTPMDIVSNNGVLKAKHQSGLPLGYTRLTYIQSDGRQVINTGYVLQETDSVEVDYKLTNLTRTSDKFILGAQPVSDTSIGGFWVETYNDTNNWYVRYGSSVSANTYGSVTPTSQLSGTLAVSKNSFVVNGVEILTPNFVSMPATPMTIFNRISLDGSIPNKGASAQISEVRVKNGNNLVHRYIAVRNSNNELGMYDLMDSNPATAFHTNAGTGDFVAGDLVSDPVEIYTDGTVETINVHGKNLFDKNTMDTGHGWRLNSSNVVADSPLMRTIVIDCKPNTKYSFWHTAGPGGVGAFVMDTNTIQTGDAGTLMTQYSFATANANLVITTYTTPANAKKLYIVAGHTSTGRSIDDQLADLMVVEGTVATATAYEPYYDGGTATAEMLLKVGDYQDVQSIIDGVVTRNVGVKVLDGTEGWASYQSGACWAAGSLLKDKVSGNCISFSTHYGWTSSDISNMQNNRFLLHGTERLCIKDDRFETATGFRRFLADQYAAGTPVIIVYQLATPTTESVTGQTLQVQAGDNTLEITQASLNDLEIEARYMKGVVTSVEEVDSQGLDNNVSVSLS